MKLKCGCEIYQQLGGFAFEPDSQMGGDLKIIYCPLHKAAQDLLNHLKSLAAEYCSEWCTSDDHMPRCRLYTELIAAAEAKK